MSDRPGRVHVVCAEVPPDIVGGLGRYAERLIAALRGRGTPVVVHGAAARRGRARRAERLDEVLLRRVPVMGWGPAGSSRLPAPLRRAARFAGILGYNLRVAARVLRAEPPWARRGPDGPVVAVHDWMGCPAGILCALLGRLPMVFHVHTRELNDAPGARRSLFTAVLDALETATARLARLVVVPSAGVRAELLARGWPAARLRVVPHGFEEPGLLRLAALPARERERLRAEVRARHLPGGKGRLIVFVGRPSPHKGVGTLVRAVPRVAETYDDVRVLLVGGQPPHSGDDAAVARLIERTGVAGRVTASHRFLPQEEVFGCFLAADVCVFPSTYEPFGLVAVEAMALGRPVVVGPGFSPDVVGDGALRCVRDSPDDLAGALLTCLGDPEAAGRLGERGAAHVRARFSWDRTAEATLAVYAEAAGAGRGA
ncbi:glycosyltransferase family 4 protein [Nonomuraea bangladeshensis]|uniref:glycosyltransferase family 4 protein n=1 Tax=Nonomuraea bangladeshensis TaxID=404385 RepID=UPI0031CE6024